MNSTEYGFCFRPERGRKDCSGPLLMWVDHKGVTRFLSTGYDVRRNEWDAVSGTLIVRGASLGRRRRLNRYAKDMARDMNRIETIVKTLEGARKNFTADEITQKVMNNP